LTNSIPYDQLARTIKAEYLDSFILEGGSAIKFAVPVDEGARPGLISQLKLSASSLGYLAADVDARHTRVHMMQELFFKVAEQIDWRFLARQVVEKLVRDSGYRTPQRGNGSLLAEISEESGLDPILIRSEVYRKLNDQVFRHRGLAKDFRVAMVQLCLAELSGGDDGINTAEVLTDWLTGRNRRIGAVKPYSIFNTISRTNARYMFQSLVCWIKFAGYAGLLVLLDISRLTLGRNAHDGYIYYTRAMVLDAYEVLRKFIDGIDLVPGCLIVVLPDIEFLNADHPRGFGAYQALMYRIVDEVRDRQLVNPMSSLVRISGDA